MSQTRHARRVTASFNIPSRPDGSVDLVGGRVEDTVIPTRVTGNITGDRLGERCQTRARSKQKMDSSVSRKPVDKPLSAVRPRPAPEKSSVSKPALRSVFICFFCKMEFTCRTDLIKHQDRCSSVPCHLRKCDNVKDNHTKQRRNSDHKNHEPIVAEVKPCQTLGDADGDSRKTRPEAGDERPVSKRSSRLRLGRSPLRADGGDGVNVTKLDQNKLDSSKSGEEQGIREVEDNPPLIKIEPMSPIPVVEDRKMPSLVREDDVIKETMKRKRPHLLSRRSLLGKPNVSKDKFTSFLGLVPVTKVKDIEQEQEKHNEIIEIDLTDESDVIAPKSPRTPATPRTLKSLLSFDASHTKSEDESSSSESETSGEKAHSHHDNIITNRSLLSIAFSSNLGQKLEHLMEKVVEHSHRENDYELYCRTPMKNNIHRLRFRDTTFPVTFRKNKHYRRFYHHYKFTKKQKSDFMKTVTTGLNARSRRLYKSLPKCSVKLKRLTNRDIKRLSKVKPKPLLRILSAGELNQWRQPNILRRVPTKFGPSSLAGKSIFLSPNRLENLNLLNRYSSVRPVTLFRNPHTQPGFSWSNTNPNRAVAQVSPIMKPNYPQKQQARVAPMRRATAGGKMVEERIDDDISIVLPTDSDCISLSSDGDSSPDKKRALLNREAVSKLARLQSMNRSYTTPLTKLPSPAKRAISAANSETSESRTFLFRCHLCGLEERHKISQNKDIYKHLHSNHRGEVIHIVDYKLHGEVHLIEAMSKPPTVMKTAPEVAKCGAEAPGTSAKRSIGIAQKPKPIIGGQADLVICLDD